MSQNTTQHGTTALQNQYIRNQQKNILKNQNTIILEQEESVMELKILG